MESTTERDMIGRGRPAGRIFQALAGSALLLGICLAAPDPAAAGPCETSARQARKACKFDVRDDLWETRAICTHISNDEKRQDCLDEADEAREESAEECQAVFQARMAFCAAAGEDRYDPAFGPGVFSGTFDDTNPMWLLTPGNHWEFEGAGETIVVEVLPETKRIAKVDCIVVNDVVADEDGLLIEDTDDWYALANNGDVYYCGENAKDYEYFRFDKPQVAELIAIDGSFKHGVDGAKAGIAMKGAPAVGDIYRQEFALGDAEDGAEVLSTSYRYGDGSGLDRRVPQALADLFCDGDCLVTREFNLIEPGPEALKYYSPGVGVFLEVEGKVVVQLVGCNVDPRCDDL